MFERKSDQIINNLALKFFEFYVTLTHDHLMKGTFNVNKKNYMFSIQDYSLCLCELLSKPILVTPELNVELISSGLNNLIHHLY